MGCCFSRTAGGGHRPAKAPSPESFSTPVVVEEETVKEVLSETPIAKPCSLQQASENKVREPAKAEEGVLSETSQVTELCSNMSESISMATTISEQKEDEASSKRSSEPKTRRKRPYAGDPSSRREHRQKCPTRRAELFPDKNPRISRRLSQGTAPRETVTRKMKAGAEQHSGEIYGRRSRSPATRAAREGSKKGYTKRSGMTPLKVTGQAGEQQKIPVAGKRDEGKAEKPIGGAIQPANEAAENPLVSLECFIFL